MVSPPAKGQFRWPVRNVPLHLVLAIPVVLQLVGTVGLVGYLSFRNGQQAVEEMAVRLQQELSSQVVQGLTHSLDEAQRVNRINIDAIASGSLDPANLAALDDYLHRQLREFTTLNSITISTEQPNYIGLGYNDGDRSSLYLSVWNPIAGGTFDWQIDPTGERRLIAEDQDYDHRQRPWYEDAVRAGGPVWSEIFTSITPRNLILSANQPFYDAQGRLLGVASTDLGLEQISQLLLTLNQNQGGQIFIIERDGDLVAWSSPEAPYRLIDGGEELTQIKATDSADALIRDTALHLTATEPELMQLSQSQPLKLRIQNHPAFVYVTPFQDPRGLDWLVVMAVPESRFMAQIDVTTRTTALLCTIAAIASIGLSLVIARGIARPLQRLNRSAKAMATGSFSHGLSHSHIAEVAEITQSFQAMATQLNASLESLATYNRILEDQLDAFFRLAPVGMAIIDDQFRFVRVNEPLASITGRPLAAHLNQSVWEITPDLAPVLEPLSNTVLTTGRPILNHAIQGEVPSQPGVQRDWITSYFPLSNGGDRPTKVGMVMVEVSDLKQAEAALKQSEEQNQAILEAIPDLMFRVNRQGICQGYIRSKSFVDLIPEDWNPIGQHLTEHKPLYIAERQLQALHDALATGQLQAYEQQLVVQDQWHYEEVRVVSCGPDEGLFMIRDITTRRQLELALETSEARLSDILNNAIAAIVSYRHYDDLSQVPDHFTQNGFTSHNWAYEFCSSGCTEVFGYTPVELTTELDLWYRHVHPEDWQRVILPRYYKWVAHHQTTDEYRFLHKDGTWHWISETAAARWEDATNSWVITVVSHDVSDRKRAELELQQAKEEAEAANRAKSAFLANMSHELRTPLNVILGFTQIMQYDVDANHEHREFLDTIQRSGDHLLSLINNVLNLSKIEAGRVTLDESTVSLIELLNTLRDMFYQPIDRSVQFMVELDPALPTGVVVDSGKLRQVLINLLNNAIKFTAQGRVTLRADCQAIAPGTSLPSLPGSNPEIAVPKTHILRFEIEDTGVGIAPEDLDSIFDAFVQAQAGKLASEGTGLGLTISRKFVQLMGGELTVRSIVGQGSTFQVYIPVSLCEGLDGMPAASDRPVLGLAPGQPTYRILVVDDHLPNRQMLVKMLTLAGLEVGEAANGQEALEKWQGWQPHLIWMDLRMPELDGYEATRRIREMETAQASGDAATKIIALTAQAFSEDREQALAAGCDDFVTKPFQDGVIFTKLTEHLGLHYKFWDETPANPVRP